MDVRARPIRLLQLASLVHERSGLETKVVAVRGQAIGRDQTVEFSGSASGNHGRWALRSLPHRSDTVVAARTVSTRSLRIDGERRTRIAQVVPDDVTPAAREGPTELVGPREHCRAARAQDERRRRVAEVDPERDAVRLDRRHHAPPSRCRGPERVERVSRRCIVNLEGCVVDQWRRERRHKRVPADGLCRAERARPGLVSQRWTTTGRRAIGPVRMEAACGYGDTRSAMANITARDRARSRPGHRSSRRTWPVSRSDRRCRSRSARR